MIYIAPVEAVGAGQVVEFVPEKAVGLDAEEVNENREGSQSDDDSPGWFLG